MTSDGWQVKNKTDGASVFDVCECSASKHGAAVPADTSNPSIIADMPNPPNPCMSAPPRTTPLTRPSATLSRKGRGPIIEAFAPLSPRGKGAGGEGCLNHFSDLSAERSRVGSLAFLLLEDM